MNSPINAIWKLGIWKGNETEITCGIPAGWVLKQIGGFDLKPSKILGCALGGGWLVEREVWRNQAKMEWDE
jgi:hypothetical protein